MVLTVGSHLEDCSHRLEKLEIGADSTSGRFHNGQNGSGTKWRQLAPIIFTSIQLLHNLIFFVDIAKLIEKVRKPSLQAFRPPYNKKLPIWQKSAQNIRASGYPPPLTGKAHLNRPLFKKGLPLLVYWHFILGSSWVNDWKCLGSKCCICVVINFYFQPTASTTHNLSLLWRLNSHEPHNEVYRGPAGKTDDCSVKKNPRPIENIVKGTFSFFGRLKTVQTDLVY